MRKGAPVGAQSASARAVQHRDRRLRSAHESATEAPSRKPERFEAAQSGKKPSKHASKQPAGAGGAAASPMAIPRSGWKAIMWRVYEEIGNDRVMAVAAGVTFYELLAIFPLIAALVTIYGLVADPAVIQDHLKQLSGVLPGGAVDVIGEQVSRISSQSSGTLGFGVVISVAISLWSANAGMKAVFDALNVAYGESEKRSFIMLNLQSLAFTLGTIVLLLIALSAVVVLPVVLNFVGLGDALQWTLTLARWPVLLLGVVFALAVLYRYGPSRDHPQWRWLSPGAVLAAVVWIAASMLFSWYAANFGSFNETYGSLGAAIGFMTWIWISMIIILVGAELNAEAERQTARDTTRGKPEPMGERGAKMADQSAALQGSA